jgi:hypothetical protein
LDDELTGKILDGRLPDEIVNGKMTKSISYDFMIEEGADFQSPVRCGKRRALVCA